MYAVIRQYSVEAGKVEEVARKARAGFMPIVARLPGLHGYYGFAAGTEMIGSISLFATRDAAEASTREASSWVKQNLGTLLRTPPKILAGEVLFHTEAGAPAAMDQSGVEIRDLAQRVRSTYDAVNERDLDRGAAAFAEDAELIDVPSGSRFSGPEGYRQLVQGWLRAFPDARIQIERLTVTEDAATVEYLGRGTHTGPLNTPTGEVAPTGRTVELRFCETMQLRDGKIARSLAYYDSATLMRQLGMLPQVAAV